MANKIILPNGCSMSKPSVNPKNWKSGRVNLLQKNWQIQYYFYSSSYRKGKLIVVKGMNDLKNLKDRRIVTKALIEDEIHNNKSGYNPILKKYENQADIDSELHPFLDFIVAFKIAITKIQCSEKHRKQLEWCVNRIDKKVIKLNMQNICIENFKRRQLKQLLEACNLPNNSYNKFLTYLSRIFGELVEYECCETNIVRDIRKRKVVRKKRKVLSSREFKIVMNYLKSNYYEFWRYSQIFLFSGARTSELLRVRAKDVDIKKQEYTIIMKKGSRPQETTKVILKEVIPLWEEVLSRAEPNEYLFSRGLKAGKNPIKPYQITKRWLRLVKKSNKIKGQDDRIIQVEADFYSLKHSFLDSLPEEIAMLIASHTNSKTTSIYRVNKAKNEREALKKMDLEDIDFGD